MLEIHNLIFGYQKKNESQFSEHIKKGSLTFIIGPNGSGKTTLLKTLAGVLRPLNGNVIYHKQELKDGLPAIERPAFLPAQSFANENLTGRDIFELYAPVKSSWSKEEALDNFKVKYLLDSPLKKLSTGEQKRIHLAATLAHPSELVILDEPLNFLDWSLEFSAVGLISRQLQSGRSFIISVHNLNWCLRFPKSQTWVLNKCLKVKSGPTEEVLTSQEVGEIFNFRCQIADNPIDGSKILVTAPKLS